MVTRKLDLMQVVFDHMPYLAWMKDCDGKYLEVNEKFVEFCGKQRSGIIGSCAAAVFPAELAACYQQVDAAAMNNKAPQSLDHIYKKNSLGNSWFDTWVAPLFDAQGEIEGTIGYSRKISKRKILEMELEQQKKFLRTMMDTIPDIIVYKDINSTVLGCNKACLDRFYGAADEQAVIGKTTVDIIKDHELAESCLQKDQQVFVVDQTTTTEEKYVLVDGSVIDVETIKTPYHAKNGEAAGLIAVSRDITARKKLEQELRKREAETQWELELAARVQLDALPLPFAGMKVRAQTMFLPYHTVSGDLFNYKWLEKQDELRGYIVDVSGHGVATALQTATIKMLLDNVLLNGTEIKEEDFEYINRKMNEYLYQESFAGILYFEFDFQTAMLKVISGGINFFLAAKQNGCAMVPINSGFLGMFAETDLQTMIMPFKAGEVYCMMTDGVSDLIEIHGLEKQDGVSEYTAWLEKLSESSQRHDDFSFVNIEILQDRSQLDIRCTRKQGELSHTQCAVSNFLERKAPNYAGGLEVAINEAINNGLSVGDEVHIKIRQIGNRLVMRVKDTGPGFDTKKIAAMLKTVNCDEIFDQIGLHDHGRGILMMKFLCDRLFYNAQGNEILLVKDLAGPDGDPALPFMG